MTDKQINVPSECIDSLLKMIESRILEIGKTYHANGQNWQDDLEITALRAMANQLGFDFEILSIAPGFSVTRYPYTPAE